MALQDQLASPFSDSLTPEQEAKMKTLTEQHTLLQKERQVFDVPVRVYVGCPMLTSRAWLDQAQSYKASDLERQKKAMENSLNNKISQAPAPVSCSAFTANAAELQQEMDSMQDQSGDQVCSRISLRVSCGQVALTQGIVPPGPGGGAAPAAVSETVSEAVYRAERGEGRGEERGQGAKGQGGGGAESDEDAAAETRRGGGGSEEEARPGLSAYACVRAISGAH
eukprot:2801097-Rhodomonas_salina.5